MEYQAVQNEYTEDRIINDMPSVKVMQHFKLIIRFLGAGCRILFLTLDMLS